MGVIPVVDVIAVWNHILMRRLRFVLPLGLVAGHLAGCEAPAAPTLHLHSLTQPLEGPCLPGGGGAEFTTEVATLAASITGPDMEVVTGTGDLATGVSIDNVPAGAGRIVSLFGLAAGAGQPTWRGVSAPVEVKAGAKTPVDILLAKVATLSCARNSSLEKRVFHTATLLNDGTVLVVGGAKRMEDASNSCGVNGPEDGCKDAAATESAALYDPRTGAFSAVGPLGTPRMFHTATRLADGRVVVAGGTRSALFHKPTVAGVRFPIEPTQPVDTVEVYDPATKAFTPAGTDPGGARVFAAAATLVTGEALITGGVPNAGNNDLGNALRTTTRCGGSPLSCQTGPPMQAARAGHLLFTFDPEGVFAWGGNVEANAGSAVIEALQQGQSAFAIVNSCRADADKNVFFAGGAAYSGIRMLAAGGLNRAANGNFQASLDGDREGASVFIFDLAGAGDGCVTAIAQGKQGARLNVRGPRVFAAAAGLPDEASAVIAGGFEVPVGSNDAGDQDAFGNITFTAVDAIERYLEVRADDGTVDTIIDNLQVNGVVPALREPRGGASATAIGDGTVVFVGGRNADAAVETAEVFADPKLPPQAAGFQP